MEVHAHSHTERKKWYHYFWEFFMLFLAVTLGFLVENMREQRTERQQEKQYMRSMREDVIKDTAMLTLTVSRAMSVVNHIDTTIRIIQNEQFDDKSLYTLYRVNLKALGFFGTTFTDRTTVQLRNAGAMRLIRELAVTDAIINYWYQSEYLVKSNEILEDYKTKARDKSYSIFNQKYFSNTASGVIVNQQNPKLMTTDLLQLTEFANRLNHIRNFVVNVYVPFLETQRETAKKLIKLIGEKYRIE